MPYPSDRPTTPAAESYEETLHARRLAGELTLQRVIDLAHAERMRTLVASQSPHSAPALDLELVKR